MSGPVLSTQSTTAREPGALAAFVPEGAEVVLDCTSSDRTLWDALKAKGVKRIIALSTSPVHAAPHVHSVHQGNLPTLAGASGPLDGLQATVVISDGDLPHYRNPEPYLQAARRVLAPGGMLVLATPNIQYHRAVRALAEEGWAYEKESVWARENLRFFTAYELKRLVAAHGFEALRAVPLCSDAPEALPLDAQGYARMGRTTLGPLSPSEHQSFLASQVVCLAMKPAW